MTRMITVTTMMTTMTMAMIVVIMMVMMRRRATGMAMLMEIMSHITQQCVDADGDDRDFL